MRLVAVTCASTHIYEEQLIPFIGSLRDLGGYNDKIYVIDYGLKRGEVKKLRENHVDVIPALKHYNPIISDRFKTLYEYFKDSKDVYVAEWDSDVWFAQNITDLEQYYKPSTLVATLDATYQHFLDGCVNIEHKPYIKTVLKKVTEMNDGFVLQGGFIAGDSKALGLFSGIQDMVIESEIGRDTFGVDMVAMNMFQYYQPDNVEVISIAYNCLPDWNLYRENGKFFADYKETEVKAIHVSGPNRALKKYDFKNFYPDLYQDWLKRLAV